VSDLEWNILDTGIRSAEENMLLDAHLLETLDPYALPILHFYDWERESATYGYFVNPADFLNLKEVERRGLQLARRPTGGGIVFHIWDLAFSVLIPAGHPYFSKNALENYQFVNERVLDAVTDFTKKPIPLELIPQTATPLDDACQRFCMAQPTKYDVILQGKKIAGAAQRKTKKGFLHQGTISLKMPSEEYLRAVLLPETKVFEAMQSHTFSLLSPEEGLQEGREALKESLKKHFVKDYVEKEKNSHYSYSQ